MYINKHIHCYKFNKIFEKIKFLKIDNIKIKFQETYFE